MKPLTLIKVADYAVGKLVAGTPTAAVTSVSTDTRTIEHGALYVALVGERFDGHHYLQAAVDAGAVVTLVSGPVSLQAPEQVKLIRVESAQQMLTACLEQPGEIFIGVAAVADYRAKDTASQKIKKQQETLSLELIRNPDILATVAALAQKPFCVGFAAETENLAAYAQAKLREKNLDLVVLLHGDGQYAPEYLPQMVEPIVSGRADVVFGSRMITQGGARQGGMPLYKFVGNKILTTLQNRLAKVSLTEWHSGYRAYSVASLRKINFLKNSDYFDFDSQIILQMIGARQRIVEIEIPTFYGDEISRVNGIKYGIKILIHTLKFRLSSNKSYF